MYYFWVYTCTASVYSLKHTVLRGLGKVINTCFMIYVLSANYRCCCLLGYLIVIAGLTAVTAWGKPFVHLCVLVCVFAFVMRPLVSGESPRANLHPLTVSGYLSVYHAVSLSISMHVRFFVCLCMCFQGLCSPLSDRLASQSLSSSLSLTLFALS